jgi:hypothetical protein
MSAHCIFSPSTIATGCRFFGCNLSDVVNVFAMDCKHGTGWFLDQAKPSFGAASLRITVPRCVDCGLD